MLFAQGEFLAIDYHIYDSLNIHVPQTHVRTNTIRIVLYQLNTCPLQIRTIVEDGTRYSPHIVAHYQREHGPTDGDQVWFCSNCGDGPYGIWQNVCTKCSHGKCGNCRVEET